jgi:subtilisin-like proprotein convertase family protein
VIVGDITGPSNYGPVGSLDAISLGTTSCNMGNANLLWNALPANTHPVIGGTLYRMRTVNGSVRFEQIGQSWLKHAFTALTQNLCCTCNGQGGTVLGVGCSDPYTSDRNGSQGGMGPKFQVNAHTGFYPTGTPPRPTGGNAGRLEFLLSDVTATAGGAGAAVRFFGECQYVTPDDASNNNQNNNASYREMSVSGTTDFTFAFAGNTVRGSAAVRAWKTIDPTVTQTDVQVAGDGLYIVSSKATDLGGGVYHYEYNVYNINGDRDGGSFSVPIDDAVPVTSVGFSCPVYRYGDGDGGVSFSSDPWSTTKTGGLLTWRTCSNNAIRWGNSFNFRFDAPVAPAPAGNVVVGLWKPGSPANFTATAQSPGLVGGVPPVTLGALSAATPASVPITGTTRLSVTVTPATIPPSTGITVTGNLALLHGPSTQVFYDDGTHGDVTAGDGTYSVNADLAEPLSPGLVTVPFTVADAQGRSLSCSVSITATSAPTGRCCAQNQSCSTLTAYQCTTGGGLYGGNGSSCGTNPFLSGNSFPINIIDATGNPGTVTPTTATITVPAGTPNVSGNAIVTVGLTHPWAGDLIGTLTHNATSVTLFSRPGGVNNSRDFNGTYTFSDAAATLFTAGAVSADPIPSGTYRPLGTLSSFNGQSFSGTWTLTITDNLNQLVGTINAASLYNPVPFSCPVLCGSADFNCDGDVGTDADIESFFACLSGSCPAAPCTSNADFNSDGDIGTDADIEAFFRVLGGGAC